MTHQRRVLGMTSAQIGILIGLGAAACLLFAVTGWLVMRGGNNPAPAATRGPQITATPFVLATITPTLTATAVPYEQLIPDGWVQHKTELMEIWLPSDFKPASKDADQELKLTVSNRKTSVYKMNVIVTYDALGTASVDTYIDTQLLTLEPTFRVVERRNVSLNGREAIRMVFEARVDTVDVDELVYVLQDGGTVWAVLYAAQINEFYEMLPIFEQSARTFRIVQ